MMAKKTMLFRAQRQRTETVTVTEQTMGSVEIEDGQDLTEAIAQLDSLIWTVISDGFGKPVISGLSVVSSHEVAETALRRRLDS